MLQRGLVVLTLILVCAIVGCAKKEPPKPEQPTSFSLKESGPVVTEEKIFEQQGKRQVVGDFNQDRLPDYAIIEEDKSGVSQISIYLQRETREMAKTYLKAGGIHQVGDYRISAIMVKESEGGTDLVLIYRYPGDLRELVQYRIEGDSIQEILRTNP